jgi:hypothetical protein
MPPHHRTPWQLRTFLPACAYTASAAFEPPKSCLDHYRPSSQRSPIENRARRIRAPPTFFDGLQLAPAPTFCRSRIGLHGGGYKRVTTVLKECYSQPRNLTNLNRALRTSDAPHLGWKSGETPRLSLAAGCPAAKNSSDINDPVMFS